MLTDCYMCMEHVCVCGYEFRDWSVDKIIEQVGTMLRYKKQQDVEEITSRLIEKFKVAEEVRKLSLISSI